MTNLLAAATLNESLAGIVAKLSELMDSFWIYIVLAVAAVAVVAVVVVVAKKKK